MPRPSGKDIKKSVFGGLSIQGALTSSMVSYIKWEPTIGIAAGRIQKLGLDIRSFREPITRAIKKVIIPSMQKNFQVGGRPTWPPLSDSTLEIRARLGISGSDIPLTRTGALRRVMGQFNIWTVTQAVGILADLPQSVWYGKVHQGGFGGSGGAGSAGKAKGKTLREKLINIEDKAYAGGSKGGVAPIPARPFAVIQDEDEDDITQIFIDWLEERVNAAWPVR